MKRAVPSVLSAAARRRLIATLAGAATAFALMTAAAMPARADSDGRDVARALAAIAAIALIAEAARKGERRRDPVPEPLPAPVHGPGWGHGGGWGPPRHGGGWGHGHGSRHRVLPAVCAMEFPGHRGPRTYYAEPCLRREGVEARLPRGCAEQARLRGRIVPVYAEGCLIEAGFRPEGYRRGPYSNDRW